MDPQQKVALSNWVFINKITNEFILGLNVLSPHDVSVDLRHHVLWLCHCGTIGCHRVYPPK
jgi:hypothetical protein